MSVGGLTRAFRKTWEWHSKHTQPIHTTIWLELRRKEPGKGSDKMHQPFYLTEEFIQDVKRAQRAVRELLGLETFASESYLFLPHFDFPG